MQRQNIVKMVGNLTDWLSMQVELLNLKVADSAGATVLVFLETVGKI